MNLNDLSLKLDKFNATMADGLKALEEVAKQQKIANLLAIANCTEIDVGLARMCAEQAYSLMVKSGALEEGEPTIEKEELPTVIKY